MMSENKYNVVQGQAEQTQPEQFGRANTPRLWVTVVLALAILIPSLWGFGSKLYEFIILFSSDVDGAFALSPIMNYLLASAGFLCLLIWAIFHGMFHDIERPKQTMLENEAWLDRQSTRIR